MALLSGRSISISKCQGCEGLDYRNAVMLLHEVSSQIPHVKYLIESYFSAPGNRCFSPASHHPSHQHQVPLLDSGPLLCYALSLGVSTDLFLQIATTFSSFKSLQFLREAAMKKTYRRMEGKGMAKHFLNSVTFCKLSTS